MRYINPHSVSHLYSFIGLWCPLNQSVKVWPDGASPAHPPQRGREGERGEGRLYSIPYSLSRHCSTEIQTGWDGEEEEEM